MLDSLLYDGDNVHVFVPRPHVRDKNVGHKGMGLRSALTAWEGHVCSC
ncbi:MAG: hypothetical protein Q7R39_15175 [Dehalococcoidia bacterium]|nr:hypothetical protein [Dehalococcoidia bacterium]